MFKSEIFHQFWKNGLTEDLIKQFQDIIWCNYQKMERKLPWRETKNPYHIFVSEFMLQQTQVERVKEKYSLFTSKYPDFASLALAPLEEIITMWHGLGYNRRAVWMKQAAERVYNEYNGILPKDPTILEKFKGIGHATAREMTVFSYNIREPFIETNIRRVYIYFFFCDKSKIDDNEILTLVDQTIDDKNPREWFYALMDYGVMLKKKFPRENPNTKSAQYTKQSKFNGSNRQLRGKILKLIIDQRGIEIEHLISIIVDEKSDSSSESSWNKDSVMRNIAKMQEEGIIRLENSQLFIA